MRIVSQAPAQTRRPHTQSAPRGRAPASSEPSIVSPSEPTQFGHDFAQIPIQRRTPPRVQLQEFVDPNERLGPQFSCNAYQMMDAIGTTTASCCAEGPLEEFRRLNREAVENVDRAIDRIAGGRRMDGVIATHFGAGQISQRPELVRRLRAVRQTLVTFEGANKTYGCRGVDSECDIRVAAYANADGVVFCGVGPNRPYFTQDWVTLLHEMFHVTYPNTLPRYESATPAQQSGGEFETYYDEHGSSQDPRNTRYAATAYSLVNADSYAELVRVIGASNWSEEPASAAAFVPMLGASVGSLLTSPEPVLALRLTHTPYGHGFLWITAGATGLWTPGHGELPTSDPAARQTRAYVGGNLGLRAIAGSGSVAGVFDLSAGVGARFTRGGDVDLGVHARAAAGLRFGSPSLGGSVGVDLQRVFDFATRTRLDEGWILGGFLNLHFGGHSGHTR
jgi:hypothetical protein